MCIECCIFFLKDESQGSQEAGEIEEDAKVQQTTYIQQVGADGQTFLQQVTPEQAALAQQVIYIQYTCKCSGPIVFAVWTLVLNVNIFYCVNTSYPMDNSLSGRRRPARQTPEKDVLCLH